MFFFSLCVFLFTAGEPGHKFWFGGFSVFPGVGGREPGGGGPRGPRWVAALAPGVARAAGRDDGFGPGRFSLSPEVR